MVLGLNDETEDQLSQIKDLGSGYLDKGTLVKSIQRLGTGEALSAGAKASGAIDIGIGGLDVAEDIHQTIKDGKITIAGDNTFKKAANVAGIIAGISETAGLADPMLLPAAIVVGGAAELSSDVLGWFGDKEDAKKNESPAMKQTQTLSNSQPPRIPAMVSSGMLNLHNNNILQKVIS